MSVRNTALYGDRGKHQALDPAFRRVLVAIAAIVIGFLLVGAALGLNIHQASHASEEQIHLGVGVSGTYTDTFAADGTYRVIEEEYVRGESRTSGDDPSEFSPYAAYTDVINFTPYTMPSQGGCIHRIGVYVFEAAHTQMRVALYEDTEGVPRLLLAQSDPVTVTEVLTPTGWLWFDIEPRFVSDGSRYWLAYQASNRETQLGSKWIPGDSPDGYRFRGWEWGPFPDLAGTTSGPINYRTCWQVAYTTTQNALDVEYTIPVTPMMDMYTLTVRGATSEEPFVVTADGQAMGVITYSPMTRCFFSDDMESGVGGWTPDGFTRIVTDSSHYRSPVHVWWTDDVPYSSTTSLTSVPVALPFNVRDAELRFWHRVVSEYNYDGGWVEYRIQNQDSTWPLWSTLADAMFLEGAYNSQAGGTSAWTGTITDVVRVQVPSSAAGRSIQWRWVFRCDPIGTEGPYQPDGWWIDDVQVVGRASDDTEIAFSLPLSLAEDGEVVVGFRDTITNSYRDSLGVDLVEITGVRHVPTVAFSSASYSEGEGAGTATMTVTLSEPATITATVDYGTGDGTAVAGEDYAGARGTLVFAPGVITQTFAVTIIDDALDEDDESLLLSLADPDDVVLGTPSTATLIILDNDPLPSLNIGDANVTEGDSGTTDAGFTVTLSAVSGRIVTVDYATADDTAIAPSDYVSQTGALNFAPGTAAQSVTVAVRGDEVDESDETFYVDLVNATNATISGDRGKGTITDDDAAGVTIAESGGSTAVTEGGPSDTYQVALDSQPTAVVTITVSPDGQTTVEPTSWTFDAVSWNVPQVVTVTAVDDALVEGVHAGIIEHTAASDDSSYDGIGIDSVTVEVTDDDDYPSVVLTAPNGGEIFQGGAACQITWSADASDDIGFGPSPIALYYSIDRGVSFPYTITSATENDGVFAWSVPELDTASARVQVVATDLAGHSSDDLSDADLTIDSTPPWVEDKTPANGSTVSTGTPVISATLADATSGIDAASITMTVDGDIVAHTYDHDTGVIFYAPSPALTNDSHPVAVSAQDEAGNGASWEWSFSVNEPPASLLLTARPMSIVADGVSTATVTATVRSGSGYPVADGTEVVFSTTMGSLAGRAVYTATTRGGEAVAVLTAPGRDGTAVITATAGEVAERVEVQLTLFHIYVPAVFRAHPSR